MTTPVWPFRPQHDLVESLEWMTDVMKAKRAEQRECLRVMPRIFYQCKYILGDADYGAARELARTVGGDSVLVPDWPNDAQVPSFSAGTASLPVDATFAPAYLSGAAALIWDSNARYEAVTVSGAGTGTISISAATMDHVNPSIVPLRLGTFTKAFDGERGPYDFSNAEAEFRCIYTEDLSTVSGGPGYPTYRGDQVITDPVEIINGAKESNVREVETVDSQVGPLYNYPIFATPNQSAVLGWTARNASDLWSRRAWLHSKKGKWKQFWVLSWNNDVQIAADIAGGDGTIRIVDIGFASKYPNPTDLAIVAPDGGMWFVRVTGATPFGTGFESLTLSAPFVGSVSLANISKTCKMTLSRLDSDRIDIQHLPGRQATIVAATKEVPVYP